MKSEKPQITKKKLWIFRLFILLVLAACIGGLEIFANWQPWHARFLPPLEYPDYPDLGWGLKPEEFPEKNPDAFRILFLGDSFTYGNESYVKNFSDFHQECQPDSQVINLGVQGYGTAQELMMWRYRGKDYQPKVVVLTVFGWNDIADNLNDIYYSPRMRNRSHFVLEKGQLVKVSNKDNPLWFFMLKHFQFARIIDSILVVKFPEFSKFRFMYYDINQYQDFYKSPLSKRGERGYKTTFALIEELRRELQTLGIPLLLVYLDSGFTVEEKHREELTLELGERFTSLDIDLPTKRFEEFTAKTHLPFLNLVSKLKNFKESFPEESVYLPSVSGHFNEKGKELAGRAIHEKLVASEMVQCNNPS